ncbi:MAG: bifunctional 3'-5' exonuclease/DNA polymerase [Cryobacterium sp.]|uniref:bifunctional 3'-5' exonuclease/DNA polymerase n=1 Tax=Cryobacterium sp. TaxID=1926290 RepID=UPI0022A13697|nr:bifunctional 3'-5' exonuclease/DNA polymerase [Cryobacterium sp.]MCY7403498.1 bifunctional 3'-5' exonuclease/DNA polymerase [Cryobacterium sp.]
MTCSKLVNPVGFSNGCAELALKILGTKQVTLNGRSLHYWAAEAAAGDATGEGVGGGRRVVAPKGDKVAGWRNLAQIARPSAQRSRWARRYLPDNGQNRNVYVLVRQASGGDLLLDTLDNAGAPIEAARRLTLTEFRSFVTSREPTTCVPTTREPTTPRWVWKDTAQVYPMLLAAGVRVQRCLDLRLCHVILKNSALTSTSELALAAPNRWDVASAGTSDPAEPRATLFDFDVDVDSLDDDDRTPSPAAAATLHTTGSAAPGTAESSEVGEFRRQLDAVASATEPGRLRLLLAAESAGALVAAEMRHAGLPWRTDVHDLLLTRQLGPRVAPGVRPERLEVLARRIRSELGDTALNPDSPQELVKALQRAGLAVTSTRGWVLKKLEHPVIEPLLQYKKLSRLLSANGWTWMDSWVVDGRFHPDYVPGGVVTGRWATRGGGALQLPKQIRGAVVADDGWKLVVADAAQLEPRILAALSQDTSMARAGRGTDLYAGIVSSGVVETRDDAKVAMLGAMYGATTGQSGRLMPRLARAYPRAIALTESAARAGERGEVVTTRLGRSSPIPGPGWHEAQAQAYDPAATAADERRARSQARDWGRFTRNFIVQGSAAEWALCWMAEIRRELSALAHPDALGGHTGSGFMAVDAPPGNVGASGIHVSRSTAAAGGARALFGTSPHLVFFLHDEVIVHTPAEQSDAVVQIIVTAAETAGRLLFGDFPVDFMLTVATVDNYAQAK